MSLTFQRNLDKQAKVVTIHTTSLIPTDLKPPPLASEPTRNEEEENMEEINPEIDEVFSDLQEGLLPQIHDPTSDHIPTTPITLDHSASPSPSPTPSPNPKPAPKPAASEPPWTQPSVPTTFVSGPSVQNQPDTHPAIALI